MKGFLRIYQIKKNNYQMFFYKSIEIFLEFFISDRNFSSHFSIVNLLL